MQIIPEGKNGGLFQPANPQHFHVLENLQPIGYTDFSVEFNLSKKTAQ
jgi:hypothetical protein